MRLTKHLQKNIIAFSAMVCSQISAQSINFTMGNSGLTSLTYGSKSIVTSPSNGMFFPQSNSFKRADGTTYSATIGSSYSVDLAKKIVTNTNDKFIIQCQYVKVSDTQLDLKVVVKNTSSDTLKSAGGRFLILTSDSAVNFIGSSCIGMTCGDGTPQVVPSWGNGGWNNNSDGGPQISFFSLGSVCNVAVCNMSNPQQGHSWSAKPTSSTNVLTFTFNLSSGSVAPNSYSDTCNISFRFDAPGKLTYPKLSNLCSDAAMRYGGSFPSKVNWLDRRPIGYDQIAESDSAAAPPNNPNKWFQNDVTINVNTAAGLENFRSRVLGRADACISEMRKINAQGFIQWNIEGQGFAPNAWPVDFPGDPDMATTLAPEWNYKGPNSSDSLIDEYFKKISDAGIVPGLCIRPQKIMMVNGKWRQVGTGLWDVSTVKVDPAQETFEDVDYAYKRWGVKLFYMDSNAWDPMQPSTINVNSVLTKALIAHPDVVIFGEWQTVNYYQWSSVFDQKEQGVTSTPPGVRMVYPDAFTLLHIYNDGRSFSLTPFITSTRKGDILAVPVWFHPPESDSIMKVNTINGPRPYGVKLTAPSDNAIVGRTFTMTATASDSGVNAGIDSVEFLSSGIKIGVDKTAPYSFTWTNAIQGKHSLYARAIDKTKNQACSSPVNVIVDATAIRTIDGPMLKNSLKGPISVSVYSLNGRLIKKMDDKDPARLLTPVVMRGLSSGIYIMKIKHTSGAIDKRKMEVVW